ncbi:hypothetical protein P3S67_010819 [Capsicum chacoense]
MLLVLSGNALCDNSSIVGPSNGKDIIGCFSTFEVGVYHVHTSDIYTSKKGIVCINYNSLCQAQHQLYPLYNITKMQQLSALQVWQYLHINGIFERQYVLKPKNEIENTKEAPRLFMLKGYKEEPVMLETKSGRMYYERHICLMPQNLLSKRKKKEALYRDSITSGLLAFNSSEGTLKIDRHGNGQPPRPALLTK